MRINKFQYTDNSLEWKLENIDFEKLTLLVGASGVGKTQILNAIKSLQRITKGKSISGIKWLIDFQTLNGNNYIWEGEFENKGLQKYIDFDDDDSDKKIQPKIIKEIISLNGVEIVKRDIKNTYFKGAKTLKFSSQQSTIHILKEEESLKYAFDGFRKIIYSDYSESQSTSGRYILFDFKNKKKYTSLKKIQESDEDILMKLFYVSTVDKKAFQKIKDRFCEIFPQVENLKIEPLNDIENSGLPSFFRETPFIQIKEFGVDKWIQQAKISSGMFRSLIHISEIYLCSEGTVFLIDEFENSLGINCIDELTADILKSQRDLQFIITSHHPYIINNIHFKFWKLITRKHGVVRTHPISDFNIGESKHDAFMQLMQLEEYQTGME